MFYQNKTQYDEFMQQYHASHAHCPKCGSTDHWTTLVGYIVDWNHKDTYRDGNKCTCNKCGWIGIKHDMV